MRKTYAAAAVVAGSMLAGGAIGVAVLAPHLANAASNPSSPAATLSGSQAPSNAGGGTFHSNEDPAHEAQESPEREAEEDSGRAFHGGGGWDGHHGFNEDPAHEAQESPEREAQEDQESNGSGQTAPQAAPASPAS